MCLEILHYVTEVGKQIVTHIYCSRVGEVHILCSMHLTHTTYITNKCTWYYDDVLFGEVQFTFLINFGYWVHLPFCVWDILLQEKL
jgi:hypothetical protein